MKVIIYQNGEPTDIDDAVQKAQNAEIARMYENDEDKKDANKTLLLLAEQLKELKDVVKTGSSPQPPPVYTAVRAPVNNQGRPKRTYNNNNNNNNDNNNNNRYNGYRGYQRDLRNVQCFNCQQFGHVRSNCRSVKCQLCGKLGHEANKCSNQPPSKNC